MIGNSQQHSSSAAPTVPSQTIATTVTTGPSATEAPDITGTALYTFSNPVRLPPALFGEITVRRDIWAAYSRTNPYSVHQQQHIENWDDVNSLIFEGTGADYIKRLHLRNTSDRPIQLQDNLVFLYCPDVQFNPHAPFDTLFLVTHVRYQVANIQGATVYFDKVQILFKPAVLDPALGRICCSTTRDWTVQRCPALNRPVEKVV